MSQHSSQNHQTGINEKQEKVEEPLLDDKQDCPPALNSGTTACAIIKYATWPVLGMLFHPMYSVINAAVVGRMETKFLAALGLGSLTTGICLISINTCFALVVGSFVAPAHGVGDNRLARMYLHRQWVLNCCTFLVTLLPIFFLKPIYLGIGQDEETATLACQYVWIVAPAILPYVQAVTIMDYAMSHGYTSTNIFILTLATLVHVLCILIFVTWLEMGFLGVCLATSIGFVSRLFIALIYTCWIKQFQETRDVAFFSRESTTNLKAQFSRGAYSLMMGVWSWWAFDIFTLIASYLSAELLSAQTIMRSLGLLTFMVPVGFSKACGFYVGVFIGRGSEASIKHYYNVSMIMAIAVGIFQMLLLWALKDQVIAMYTDQHNVQEQMRAAWLVFLIFVFFDTTQGIGSSAIRASGKQKMGSFITGLAYWAIGIPLTCMLVFWQTLGMQGIWIGPTSAVFFVTISYQLIVMRTDWQALIAESREQREAAKKVAIVDDDDYEQAKN